LSTATVQIIANVVQVVLLAILAALVKAWSDRQNANHAETKQAIEVVRSDVNGKMEKMQEVIKTGALAEGTLIGRAEAKAEAKAESEK
jgi:hypothetical protein